MEYSLTQAGNITAIAGVVALILHAFNINIASSEIEALLGGVLGVVGILISWYGRYRQGDLKLSGVRKQTVIN